ncbi:MAG: peptide ABC transporter substrate-binding protein [Phycisphaerae bacterium]
MAWRRAIDRAPPGFLCWAPVVADNLHSARPIAVLRLLAILVLVPMAALLVWLGLGPAPERADFVLTSDEPRTLDPHGVSWIPEIQIANALFEGLTRAGAETFLPEPAVAESWEVSPDQTEWTFHLRPEARWSNGDPVTAEDFRFAWLRVLDPHVAAQYASLLFVVRGAEAYYRSRADDDPGNDVPAGEVGVSVDDAQTLRVTLAAPCSYFLDLTSFPTLAPVHRPTIERWAYRDGRVLTVTQHLWTRPENMVCNGAFVLARWTFKKRILLERNPFYWDPAGTNVNTIEVYISNDPNAALMAYEAGRVDLIRGMETPVARALLAAQQAGQRNDFHIGDRFATFFYRVNCRRPPLDDADLRRALSLAIDREAICAHVMGLGEAPARTYVPPGAVPLMPRQTPDGRTVYYAPPAGLGEGLSQAQREVLAREYLERHLRRAGLDGPGALRPLELAFGADPEQRRVAEAVQQMWVSALGIRVDLRAIEGKVLSTRIRELDYDLARSNWYGDYLDPSTFLNMFATGDGQNRTGWSDLRYDELIAAAAREPDNERRYEQLAEAERILCTEGVPIITVFHRRGNFLLRPGFAGLNDHVRDLLPIHRVRRVAE